MEVRFNPANQAFPKGVRLVVCADDDEIDLYNTLSTRVQQRRVDASVGLTAALTQNADEMEKQQDGVRRKTREGVQGPLSAP